MALQTIANLFQDTYNLPKDDDFILIFLSFLELILNMAEKDEFSGLYAERDLQMDVLTKGLQDIGWYF